MQLKIDAPVRGRRSKVMATSFCGCSQDAEYFALYDGVREALALCLVLSPTLDLEMAAAGPETTSPEIYVNNLTFQHNQLDKDATPSLIDINLALPKGSRTILVGANGGEPSCTPWR